MSKKSLIKKMETYQQLSGAKIVPSCDPHDEYESYLDYLKHDADEYTMDELAEIMEMDYIDFSDYIDYIRYEQWRHDWYMAGEKHHLLQIYRNETYG